MFDIHPLVNKLNEGEEAQVVASNIQYPPFIFIFEVISS
ncbi:MAG: hypothetical protein OFPI_39320 [Osedax symbiont Rs2]|nr:MAG: hypothetical protein OFPI_39320 [Osedax symbiont Rs2]